MKPSPLARLRTALVYGAAALAVTAVWVHCARTEYGVDERGERYPSGEVYSARFCSIVRLAQGRAYSPFVRRRLLVDLARGLAAVIPSSWWEPLQRCARAPQEAPPWLGALLRRQEWKAEDIPLMGCAYFLIGCSVLGFMLSVRWLVLLLYEAPRGLADAAAVALGLALLGGNSDWHYCGYPYDFPQAFVFTLALAALAAGRRWYILVFAAGSYSKETSILLIAAYVLLARDRRSLRFWAGLALQAGLFAGIRGWLELHYPAPQPPAGFGALARNLKYLGLLPFYSWPVPFFAVGVARMVALRRHFPPALKRLAVLAVPLVGIALFRGWLEELRQYLEMLPVLGLLVLQWCLHEAGHGHLLRARAATAAPAQPGARQPAIAA
jgi:hypothetical protein